MPSFSLNRSPYVSEHEIFVQHDEDTVYPKSHSFLVRFKAIITQRISSSPWLSRIMRAVNSRKKIPLQGFILEILFVFIIACLETVVYSVTFQGIPIYNSNDAIGSASSTPYNIPYTPANFSYLHLVPLVRASLWILSIHITLPISGAWLNPIAVLSGFLTRKISFLYSCFLILSHCFATFLGVFFGAFVIFDGLESREALFTFDHSGTWWRALIAESLWMFIFTATIWSSVRSTLHLTEESGLAPLSILFSTLPVGASICVVTLIASLIGSGGACVNPFMALALQVVSGKWTPEFYIYYIAPIVGGIFGSLFFELLSFWTGKQRISAKLL